MPAKNEFYRPPVRPSAKQLEAETAAHLELIKDLPAEALRAGYRELYLLNAMLRRQLVEMACMAHPVYVGSLSAQQAAPRDPVVPWDTFTRPTCKGCFMLNTACGHCERCEWERKQLGI